MLPKSESCVTSDARCLLSVAGHPGQMHTLGGGRVLPLHTPNKAAPTACPPAEEPLPRSQAVQSVLPVIHVLGLLDKPRKSTLIVLLLPGSKQAGRPGANWPDSWLRSGVARIPQGPGTKALHLCIPRCTSPSPNGAQLSSPF